nr:hypothetical protein [Salmonella enterica subsp. enterica serovar Rissen]
MPHTPENQRFPGGLQLLSCLNTHVNTQKYLINTHAGYRMGKDYLTDLQEWVKQKKGLNGKSANSARVVFLAIREDVKTRLKPVTLLQRYGNTCTKLVVLIPHTKLFVGMSGDT